MYALCTLTCLCSIIKQLGQKEKATLFLSNNTTTLGNHFDLLISRGSKYSFNSLEIIALLILVAKPLPINYQKSRGVYFPNQLVFYKSGKARQFWPLRQASLWPGFGTSVQSMLMNLPQTNIWQGWQILYNCLRYFWESFFSLFQPGAALMAFYSGGSDQPPPLRHLHQDEPTWHNGIIF